MNNKKTDSIQVHEKHAGQYDKGVLALDCHDHDVLFGLGFEYIKAGERLIDIGIGTGMSSAPFHRAGLQISGIDGCAAMIEQCHKKNDRIPCDPGYYQPPISLGRWLV